MLLNPRLQAVFLLNAAVLITHQIDAAYWHEWELFRIPGGNQINLLLNFPIIALVLYAQGQVRAQTGRALRCYQLMVFLGLLTVAIHSAFFAFGAEAFMQPVSIALLAATAILSIGQLLLLRGEATACATLPQAPAGSP
ncbi:hypothetical protein Jab_2c21020 [Janthinobacterium sp. HH01]|uniref:DUF6713 family protein n=1 Tax=Janthinobacterium sp. HH01 TaxID=1198452 RepID=UPI0002AED73C|nr:DUF6713 family protein [Janthinobacterium sp. HH01]ELX10015.1 hypothetical protein Jab_2c21020 [Janthinobacterium sp. HH01]